MYNAGEQGWFQFSYGSIRKKVLLYNTHHSLGFFVQTLWERISWWLPSIPLHWPEWHCQLMTLSWSLPGQYGIPLPHTQLPPKGPKMFYVPTKGFLFSHQFLPNSLVVQAATEWAKHQLPWSTPAYKEGKHLDLLGCKVFSSSSLQFRIKKYQVYQPNTIFWITVSLRILPVAGLKKIRLIFRCLKLVARIALSLVVDAPATSSRAMAIVMRRESWLHSSGFLREVKNTSEDVIYD